MMSNHDEAFATRIREALDVVGSAAPRADREHWPPQHADRPAARPGRWLAGAAAVVLVAVGVWALASRGSETSPVTPDTTVTVPSTSTTTAQQRIISTWVDRVTGQTIAYEMDLSCFCSPAGKWAVVERDGTVLQAEYLGDGEPDRPSPPLLMTSGLELAATANGPVLVSGDDTTLQLSVDVDVDSIDDEFGFTITNFRVLPDYPQGAPTGPKVNYQLAGQLALVRGPEDTTPVSGAVRAVDPRDGNIVTYAATNDDGTFSLYVPAGTYRLVGITPQYEAGQIQCKRENITVPHLDATSLLLGCPRPVPNAVSPGCSDFRPRYIGSGLTVSLPQAATFTTGGGTADPGPVHAGVGFEFDANGALVSVGRNLGHDDSPEPNVAKRVDGDVVVWVKSSDAVLRQCLLETTRYSAALDQKDEN